MDENTYVGPTCGCDEGVCVLDIPAQPEESSSMSTNGRTEAIMLVVETRDWFRAWIEREPDGLVEVWTREDMLPTLRKLDRSLELLQTIYGEVV